MYSLEDFLYSNRTHTSVRAHSWLIANEHGQKSVFKVGDRSEIHILTVYNTLFTYRQLSLNDTIQNPFLAIFCKLQDMNLHFKNISHR